MDTIDVTADKRFIEKVDKFTTEKAEILSYYIGLSSCFLVHIVYLLLFKNNGINEMAVFNVFSVTFYFITVLLIKLIKNRITLVFLAIIVLQLILLAGRRILECSFL